MTPTAALELAEAVVADGFGVHRKTLAALLAEARRHGVGDVLVDVAGDPAAPRVARERALGRVIVELAHREGRVLHADTAA